MAQRIVIRSDVFNAAFLPFLEDETRNQFLYGGAGSGKSVFVARRAVLDVARNDRNYLVARGTQRAIRGSTWNEILDAINFFGLNQYFDANKSDLTITCNFNDRQFAFVGCDDPEKIKSIRPRVGVFTDLWEEEATEISAPADKQLRLRLRGKSPLPKRYTYTFNPIYKTHHIYKRYFSPLGIPETVRVHREADTVIFRSTYRDNRFLEPEDIKELLSLKGGDPYWYQVYAEGLWGVLGHRIFSDWETADLSESYSSVDEWYNGLDFGYTNDPTAFSRSARGDDRKSIYIYYPQPSGEVYTTGLTNQDITEIIHPVTGSRERIYCDSAEPKSIQELRQAKTKSLNAVAVKKGKDSVLHGLQWLQRHHLVIDCRNQHAINELSIARWAEDRDGNPYNRPVDADNHFIDSLRYAWEREMVFRKPMLIVSTETKELIRSEREAQNGLTSGRVAMKEEYHGSASVNTDSGRPILI